MSSFDVSPGSRRGGGETSLCSRFPIQLVLLFVTILGVFLIGCSPNEDRARRNAIRSQKPEPCVDFLEKFPGSPFRTEVQGHLEKIIDAHLETSLQALLRKPPDFQGAQQPLQSLVEARATNALLLNNYAVLLARASITTTNLLRACDFLEQARACTLPVAVPDVSVCVYCERLPWPMSVPNKLQVFVSHNSPLKTRLLSFVSDWTLDKNYIIFPGEVFVAPVRAGRWDHRKADPPDQGFVLKTEIENNLKTLRLWVETAKEAQ